MFPYPNVYRSLNSSSIEVTWLPSSRIKDIDLTQLTGTVTIGLYAGDKFNTYNSLIYYPLTKLNESGSIVINNLKPDSIYKIYVETVWKDDAKPRLIVTTIPETLVRTYMQDEKTLNKIPWFGAYDWKQVDKDSTTVSVIFNTTFASVLPYDKRTIRITLDSQSQNQSMDSDIDFILFTFDLNITTRTYYSLAVTYKAFDHIKTPYLSRGEISKTSSTTIYVEPPEPSPPLNTASKLLRYNSFLCCIFYVLSFYL